MVAEVARYPIAAARHDQKGNLVTFEVGDCRQRALLLVSFAGHCSCPALLRDYVSRPMINQFNGQQLRIILAQRLQRW